MIWDKELYPVMVSDTLKYVFESGDSSILAKKINKNNNIEEKSSKICFSYFNIAIYEFKILFLFIIGVLLIKLSFPINLDIFENSWSKFKANFSNSTKI